LFTFVLTFNLVTIFMCLNGKWPYARTYAGAFVLGNLQTAVLVRNEWFTRFLYLCVNTCFSKVSVIVSFPVSQHSQSLLVTAQWPPLRFRLACTSILQHLGGVHSGCALSAVVWLVFRIVQVSALANSRFSKPVLVTGVMTLVAVIVGIISAIPWVRNTHHK
jgi:hypothetical protein